MAKRKDKSGEVVSPESTEIGDTLVLEDGNHVQVVAVSDQGFIVEGDGWEEVSFEAAKKRRIRHKVAFAVTVQRVNRGLTIVEFNDGI